MPLLRHIDFELPFGSATYRHVRSYSEKSNIGWQEYEALPPEVEPPATPVPAAIWRMWAEAQVYYDWYGQGWMIGENPLFLFDAAWYGVVRKPAGETTPATPPRCYFMPDAHRAIPFERQSDGTYLAPPQFDASLFALDGVWGTNEWTTEPTQFELWMHGRSVKYSIRILPGSMEILANNVSAHVPPDNYPLGASDGRGIPRIGVVETISDRNGNRMEMDHCAVDQTDAPGTWDGCIPCLQSCAQRGQLVRTRLFAAGETAAAWTIFYVNREFRTLESSGGIDYPTLPYPHAQQPVVSVYVYQGDRSTPTGGGSAPCLTLPIAFFDELLDVPAGEPPDEDAVLRAKLEALMTFDAAAEVGLPSDWVRHVRCVYDESAYSPSPEPQTQLGPEENHDSPRLIAVVAQSLGGSGVGEDDLTTNTSLYRYRWAKVCYQSKYDGTNLAGVYLPDTVARLVKILENPPGGGTPEYPPSAIDLMILNPSESLIEEGGIPGPTDDIVHGPLGRLADEVYTQWDDGHCGNPEEYSGSFTDCDVRHRVPVQNPSTLATIGDGVASYFARHNDGSQTHYRVYRYLVIPDGGPEPSPPKSGDSLGDCSSESFYYVNACDPGISRAISHHPYRYIHEDNRELPGDWIASSDLSKPLWVAVVHETARRPDVYASDPPVNGEPEPHPQFSEGSIAAEGVKLERVIMLNAAGDVLSETVFDVDGDVVSTTGILELYLRDEHGRLTEIRSPGWGAPGNVSTQETEGLIKVFDYTTSTGRTLKATGIKRGDGVSQPAAWLKEYRYEGDPPRPTMEIVHHTPVIGTLPTEPPSDAAVTTFSHTMSSTTPAFVTHRSVTSPTQLGADGLLRRTVQTEVYDNYGRLSELHDVIRVEGSTEPERNTVTTFEYEPVEPVGSDPALPGRLLSKTVDDDHDDREPEEGALELTTTYEYDSKYLRKVTHPNGRMEFHRRSANKRFLYRDVVLSGTDLVPLRSGIVTTMAGGGLSGVSEHVVKTEEVIFSEGITNPPSSMDEYDVVATITPEYDSGGRPSNLVVEGENSGPAIASEILFGNFGIPARIKDPNGQITRNVCDRYGRLTHLYRGIDDHHEIWGTANPLGNYCLEAHTDDLVLTEKRYYGDGTGSAGATNAHKLTAVRRYRNKPANQYSLEAECSPPIPANNEDTTGYVEEYLYDWRMRQCIVIARNSSGAAKRHTVTFYDDHDRPRLQAVYGATFPTGSAADPRELDLGDPLPTAAAIVALTTKPASLTETIYDANGLVLESRQYNVPSSNYLATIMRYDGAGRPTLIAPPGSTATLITYDGLGREVVRSEVAFDHAEEANPEGDRIRKELVRTETAYDEDNNPVTVIRRERLHSELTDVELDDTNSVATYVFNWFDAAGNLQASMDAGTGNGDDQFVPPSTTPARPTNCPAEFSALGVFEELHDELILEGAKFAWTERDFRGKPIKTYRYVPGRSPDPWTADRTVYDSLGRIVTEIKNADDANVGNQIRTAYFYNKGLLTRIAAVRPGHTLTSDGFADWSGGASTLDITHIEYDAAVRDDSGSEHTQDRTKVSRVWFPGRDPGTDPAHLTFSYSPDGLLVNRTDARGILMTYRYDNFGQRYETVVDTTSQVNPPLTGNDAPKDMIGLIEQEFDVLGRLIAVEAKTKTNSTSTPYAIVAENLFAYDGLGNLQKDVQSLGETLVPNKPETTYTWDVKAAVVSGNPGKNYARLIEMTHPVEAWDSEARRKVQFGFGSTGSIDDLISRVRTVTLLRGGGAAADPIAEFEHAGITRRVSARRGIASSASGPHGIFQAYFDSSDGYSGLDRHGRVRNMHFTDAGTGNGTSGLNLFQGQHAYDTRDNRLFDRIKQVNTGSGSSVAHDNDRSRLFTYDTAERLRELARGEFTTTDNDEIDEESPYGALIGWSIDDLGNWLGESGTPAIPGRSAQYDLNGDGDFIDTADASHALTHTVNARNELSAITRTVTGTPPFPGPTTSGSATCIYDPSGNLATDGQFYYVYDAWGRLVKVTEKGTLTFNSTTAAVTGGNPGKWLVHFSYDGLGRLIRKQVPYDLNATELRVVDYYYDGVRRIQEVFTDPVTKSHPVWLDKENPPDENSLPETMYYVDRDYIWAPPPSGYVDECLAQIELDGQIDHVFQDVGYDVVAIADAGKPAGSPGYTNGLAARTLIQYTYDAYGQPITAEDLTSSPPGRTPGGNLSPSAAGNPSGATGTNGGDVYSHAANRIGHKGLFFDRIDGRPEQHHNSGDGAFDLLPKARGFYHVRNRTLDPVQGRWIQADPNGTGGCEMLAETFDTFAVKSAYEEVSVDNLHRDGPSRHQYVASQPLDLFDPAGTFFSAVDALGGATTASELRNEWSEDIVDRAQTIHGAIGAAFDAIAIMQMSDIEWAQDWESGDSDYFSAGEAAWAASAGGGTNSKPRSGLAYAGLTGKQNHLIEFLARASGHGGKSHRMGMAAAVIAHMNLMGLRLKDVDISFNRSPFKGSGVRVDALLTEKKTGKILMYAEVAVSQTGSQLRNRMAMLARLFHKAGMGNAFGRSLRR